MNVLMLLSIYNTVFGYADAWFTKLTTFWNAFWAACSTKQHVFFEGICSPYEISEVNMGAASSALPLWSYEDRTFTQWRTLGGPTQSLPILSMTISDKEREIHDLTDFVESIRVCNTGETFPSIAHILGAWSLTSKIVLDPTAYTVNVITTSADILTFPVTSTQALSAALTQST